MLDALGDRQADLVRQLSQAAEGLTIDELAEQQAITRPAVRMHLSALERDGYIERGAPRRTGGRPVQTYRLTPRGRELFPRQYTWFSGLVLEALRTERGSEGLGNWMADLAVGIAGGLTPRVAGKAFPERLQETARILNELSYSATAHSESPSTGVIEATNCVYHDLAARFPEVCQFDLAILARLTGGQVDHETCLVRGGGTCRFKVTLAPGP